MFFQILTNGWLTGRRIVQLGAWRILYAPVEDLLFGFGLVLLSCVAWTWLGRSREQAAR